MGWEQVGKFDSSYYHFWVKTRKERGEYISLSVNVLCTSFDFNVKVDDDMLMSMQISFPLHQQNNLS